MKHFNSTISLAKNSRGCYILDTVKGCSACTPDKPLGCYNDCYAKKIASRYNIDFSNPVTREVYNDNKQLYFMDFHSGNHINEIIRKIRKIDMPFVRIGEMGDPSENWEHTINVCSTIAIAGKPIVIITKHWKTIPDALLNTIRMLDICINTSISAMDSHNEIQHRLNQYNRLKLYCNSVLRVVSCDFNLSKVDGRKMAKIQGKLLKNDNVIDTVFRPSNDNPYVTNGIINVSSHRFLRSQVLASKHKPNIYMGMCNTCPDMCGIRRKS